MTQLGIISELCKEYTDLSDEEIGVVERAAESLPAMANMFNADAFIDCPMCDGSGDSIVVAEAKPVDNISSYKRPVVGLVATKEKEPAVHRTFSLGVATKFMKATTQEDAHVVQTVEPINCSDRVVGVFIIEQRMEYAKARTGVVKVPREEDRFDSILMDEKGNKLIDNIELGIIFVDKKNKVKFRNRAAADIYKRLGFIRELEGLNYKEIAIIKPASTDEESGVTSQEAKLGNFYFDVRTAHVGREDIDYIITIADVTSNTLQRQELILKSVAFKEMHHRVKNNLQTIVSLLRLQRNSLESESAVQALNETISRIMAIAATHEILVETEMEDVKLNDIVASIKDNLLKYYGREDFILRVEYHGGDFNVKFEKAAAVALILNELMQNSIKYAFPGRKEGKIVIMTLRRSSASDELIYIDDGCGFNVKKTYSGSMGWSIIRSLVREKLKGHVTVKSDSLGTKVRVIF